MSTRTSSLLVAPLLVLAACERAPDTATLANVEADQRATAADDGRVLCARGNAALARVCTVDRERRDGKLILTLRRPDGGFRRLAVTADGRGVIAADGAEAARVTVVDAGQIDVAIGEDRYRLPATVRAGQ